MNKYKNKKAWADGIQFDSTGERDRYLELKLLQRAGQIRDLQLQVKFELIPAQRGKTRNERPVNYIADFVYIKDGEEVVEDFKGLRTQEYIMKRKLMKYVNGIEIKEMPEKELKNGRNLNNHRTQRRKTQNGGYGARAFTTAKRK